MVQNPILSTYNVTQTACVQLLTTKKGTEKFHAADLKDESMLLYHQ